MRGYGNASVKAGKILDISSRYGCCLPIGVGDHAGPARSSLQDYKNIALQVVLPLLIALVMMFLFNRYISAAHITRFMGQKVGIKGMIFLSLAGIVSMGPVFAWFPFLKTLKEKNMADVYLANFLSSRAVKPVLIPVLIAYFGWRFSLTFTLLCLAGAWGISFVVALSGNGKTPESLK